MDNSNSPLTRTKFPQFLLVKIALKFTRLTRTVFLFPSEFELPGFYCNKDEDDEDDEDDDEDEDEDDDYDPLKLNMTEEIKTNRLRKVKNDLDLVWEMICSGETLLPTFNNSFSFQFFYRRSFCKKLFQSVLDSAFTIISFTNWGSKLKWIQWQVI